MPKHRTEAELAPIIESRLRVIYDFNNDFHTGERHADGPMSYRQWLLYWLAQGLTPDNPVDIWVDMTEHEAMEVYGFEDGGEQTEALALAILACANIEVPAEWADWDGMGEPAWLDS